MPHPNVTIRHARRALHLLISGALRDIEAEFSAEENAAQTEATVELFDELAEQMGQWDIKASRASKLEALHMDLEEKIGETVFVTELLVARDLMP